MDLASVRSLKQEIQQRGLIREMVVASALPPSGRGFDTPLPAKLPIAPVALGITGAKGAHKLAVRIQSLTPGIDQLVRDIHKRAKGEVDLRMVGTITKQQRWQQRRQQPLWIGCSVGHHATTAGTLGCFVTSGADDAATPLVLSNNHVFANENTASVGDVIVQPGPKDGGRPDRDRIATLSRFVSLTERGNLMDAAVATLDQGTPYVYRQLRDLGNLAGVRPSPLESGDLVYKIGRSTGVTRGRVSAIEMDDVRVRYDAGARVFDGQIEITPEGGKPFSQGGDSGAIIVDRWRRAVGLLFAGNDVDVTYANPIGAVLARLSVELVR